VVFTTLFRLVRGPNAVFTILYRLVIGRSAVFINLYRVVIGVTSAMQWEESAPPMFFLRTNFFWATDLRGTCKEMEPFQEDYFGRVKTGEWGE
jgi:hypothetical protein